MINIIESSAFANICSFLSAIGTVGAVIVSLYIIFKQNRVKAKITGATIDMMTSLNIENNMSISGYSITLCNLSSSQNIYLKQSLYLKCDILDEKKNLLLFVPHPEIMQIFPFKNMISPGEEYTFFLSEKQIKASLSRSKSKTLKFYFMDKFNKKYKIKIKKVDLEKRLAYIEKHKDNIFSF